MDEHSQFQKLGKKMEQDGYRSSSVADIMQFFADNPLEAELWFGPKSGNAPLSAYIDEVLGKPLRMLKALGKEIRRDIAIVLHTTNLVTLAQASDQLDHAHETLVEQQQQIDTLESAIREQSSQSDEPTASAPATIYEQMEADKEFKRKNQRCLW